MWWKTEEERERSILGKVKDRQTNNNIPGVAFVFITNVPLHHKMSGLVPFSVFLSLVFSTFLSLFVLYRGSDNNEDITNGVQIWKEHTKYCQEQSKFKIKWRHIRLILRWSVTTLIQRLSAPSRVSATGMCHVGLTSVHVPSYPKRIESKPELQTPSHDPINNKNLIFFSFHEMLRYKEHALLHYHCSSFLKYDTPTHSHYFTKSCDEKTPTHIHTHNSPLTNTQIYRPTYTLTHNTMD